MPGFFWFVFLPLPVWCSECPGEGARLQGRTLWLHSVTHPQILLTVYPFLCWGDCLSSGSKKRCFHVGLLIKLIQEMALQDCLVFRYFLCSICFFLNVDRCIKPFLVFKLCMGFGAFLPLQRTGLIFCEVFFLGFPLRICSSHVSLRSHLCTKFFTFSKLSRMQFPCKPGKMDNFCVCQGKVPWVLSCYIPSSPWMLNSLVLSWTTAQS